MIVNLFRHTQAFSILSVLSICLLIWIFAFEELIDIQAIELNPLFELHPRSSNFLIKVISALLVFWQCSMINKIVVGQRVLTSNTFFPALFYLLLISMNPVLIGLSPALISISFLLLSIKKILACYLDHNAYTKVFESAFLLSIASIIHPPFMLFYPILWIGMSIFSQVELRHWLLSFVGILCPWFLILTFGTYFNIEYLELNKFLSFLSNANNLIDSITLPNISLLVFTGLICILSLFELLNSINRKNIKSRKSYILFLWLILLSVVYSLINKHTPQYFFLIIAAPMSAIISNYFYYHPKKKWLELILIIWIIAWAFQHITY